MALQIIWNDILQEKADAIVTPASRNPRIGTGLDKLVHQVVGPELLEVRKELGNIGPGRIAVSPSFGLKKKTGAKYIIHALGPTCIAKDASEVSDELILDGCYLRILCKAVALKCKTISIPVLSSGKFGMEMGTAVDVAVRAIQDFLLAFPALTVKLVGIDADFAEYAQERYPKHFVSSAFSLQQADRLREELGNRGYDESADAADRLTLDETDRYFHEHVVKSFGKYGSFKDLFQKLWESLKTQQEKEKADYRRRHKKGRIPKGMFLVWPSDLAAASGLTVKTIQNYSSSGKGSVMTARDKIFALAVGMKLSVDCTEALLSTCGYRFSSSARDVAIREHIAMRKGSVGELNQLLADKALGMLQLKDEKVHRGRRRKS